MKNSLLALVATVLLSTSCSTTVVIGGPQPAATEAIVLDRSCVQLDRSDFPAGHGFEMVPNVTTALTDEPEYLVRDRMKVDGYVSDCHLGYISERDGLIVIKQYFFATPEGASNSFRKYSTGSWPSKFSQSVKTENVRGFIGASGQNTVQYTSIRKANVIIEAFVLAPTSPDAPSAPKIAGIIASRLK